MRKKQESEKSESRQIPFRELWWNKIVVQKLTEYFLTTRGTPLIGKNVKKQQHFLWKSKGTDTLLAYQFLIHSFLTNQFSY